MAYGQYSAGGGLNRTKGELLQHVTGEVREARKAGKNRIVFTRTDGSRGFILHETIVAELSADGRKLTLSDGGWHTPTTKSAWGDAIGAFKLAPMPDHFERDNWWEEAGHGADKWPGDRDAEGFAGYLRKGRVEIAYPERDQRSVTYRSDEIGKWVPVDAPLDLPMLRADVEDSGNFAVRFDGKDLVSDAGVKLRCTPFKLLVTLYYADKLITSTRGYSPARPPFMSQFYFNALGDYSIYPGRWGRSLIVGCHTFKMMDVRTFKRAIEGLYPHAVKPAKQFVRKHPKDFGVKAYEEERAASARRRADTEGRNLRALGHAFA